MIDPKRLPFFYGWVVVAVAFVTMGIGVNTRTAFSLLFPPILAEFGWDRGVTAGAFSVGFLVATVYVPFLGMAMDRYGPRAVIPVGIVITSAGLLLAPLTSQPWHLHVTLGALVGGGSIFMTYIGHSLFLPHWFVRRRGLAIGIAFSGVGIGSIVLFPWLGRLIATYDWRAACWALAALLVVVLLPLNATLPRRRPEDMGLTPDGAGGGSAGRPAADNVVDRAWASVDWTLARAMRTARFWWLFVGFFAALLAWYMVQAHQTKYLLDVGFDRTLAAWALGVVGLAGIVGQIALGWLSDRIGREWAWTLGLLGFGVCYAALLLLSGRPSVGLVYVMVVAQGLLGYGLASVFGAIPAEIFQGRHYGTIFGTLNLGANAGAAFGPWVAGAIYDRTGTYTAAWLLAIAACALSMVAIWLAAPRKVRAVAGRVKPVAGGGR
ncbi:MAG TPA: MFS transporter [Methylomirabilota bacterium]|nr:MFS transporter [Methylomirabilota bacterium]